MDGAEFQFLMSLLLNCMRNNFLFFIFFWGGGGHKGGKGNILYVMYI